MEEVQKKRRLCQWHYYLYSQIMFYIYYCNYITFTINIVVWEFEIERDIVSILCWRFLFITRKYVYTSIPAASGDEKERFPSRPR